MNVYADQQEPIRAVSVCHSDGNRGRVEWANLTRSETQAVEAAVVGATWIRIVEGRLECCEALEPPRVLDSKLAGVWADSVEPGVYRELRAPDAGEDTIVISSVLNPECEQRLLNYGFQCLRSRRGPAGRYWELWYLPFLLAARGKLREVLDGHKSLTEAERVKKAISFLITEGGFGSLHVQRQAAALVIE